MSEHTSIVPGIDALSSKSVKGLWVSEGKGMIGLVEQEGVGAYLLIWKDISKESLPFAATHDGVQLPRKNGDDTYSCRFISWDDLFEVVQEFKSRKLPAPA